MKIVCIAFVCCFVQFAFAAKPVTVDACKLLSASEVAQAQAAKITSAKPSSRDNGDLTSSLCFYSALPFSQSVSLQVVSHSPSDRVSVRDYWKQKFRTSTEEEEGDKAEQGGEKEKAKPPRKVEGLGEQAYWVDTGRDGALYALKNEYLLRCSVGGKADQDTKLKNCRKLLQSAMDKLPGS